MRRRAGFSRLNTITQLPRTSKVTTVTQHYGLRLLIFTIDLLDCVSGEAAARRDAVGGGSS